MNQSDCPSASPRASARRRIGGLALLSALALLLLAGPAGSQDGPDPAGDKPGAAKDDAVTTADFAPQWKVGQSWTVETFVPDLREAVTGRPEETRPEIPGFPRLRGGVPEGFKRGTVFTVTVTRNDATISDDKVIAPKPKDKLDEDEKSADEKARAEPKETYWEVVVTAKSGKARSAKLYFATADLALGEIVYTLGGKKTTRVACYGTCSFDLADSRVFGFPFDWPDLVAATKTDAELKVGRREVAQTVTRHEPKDGETTPARATVALTEKRKKGPPTSCRTEWQVGSPWWHSYTGPGLCARLVKSGGK